MFEMTGTHICERCGKEYKWIARQRVNGEVVVGRVDSLNSKHVSYCDFKEKMIIGKCPHCGTPSMNSLYHDR